MTDARTAAVLDGLALHRATGAPALACMAGYRAVDGPRPGTTLGAAADAAGLAGPTDLAMLVDLTAGAAIRARIGGDRRLATTALAVHLLGPLPPTEDLTVHVAEVVVHGRFAVAGTAVVAGGRELGHGSVAFTVLGDGLTPIPWERLDPTGTGATGMDPTGMDPTVAGPGTSPAEPLREDDLTSDEQDALRHIRSEGVHSWSEAVVRGSTTPGPDGPVLRPTGLLANRAGGVQGGVLVALAVLAAGVPVVSGVLGSVQVDFVSAATVDAPVIARPQVLREGRRSRLVRVDLVQGVTLVATATVGLRTG